MSQQYSDPKRAPTALPSDYTLEQRFASGDRVELSPACDLWMRGARFGTIVGFIGPSSHPSYKVRMDHKSVKGIKYFNPDYLRPVKG
jgi:hypothetical protein